MKEINLNSIIERISDLCAQNNISINQMLKNSGAGTSLVDNMKKGSFPSIDKLKKVAVYFDVAIEYIIGESTEQEMKHAKKYTVLDDEGKKNVDIKLEQEYKRCTEKPNIEHTPMGWAVPPVSESKAIASADEDTFKLEEPPADESIFEGIPKDEV